MRNNYIPINGRKGGPTDGRTDRGKTRSHTVSTYQVWSTLIFTVEK